MNTIISKFDHEKLNQATEILKAIAHPIRINIIALLENGKRLTVTEIFEKLDLEQAVVSHHLRILKDRGVLNYRREGKNMYYYLKHEQLIQIIQCVSGCCN